MIFYEKGLEREETFSIKGISMLRNSQIELRIEMTA